MKYRGLDFPGVHEVALVLRAQNNHIRATFVKGDRDEIKAIRPDAERFSVDVRLNVQDDGAWYLHTGDASYDQDHRGYWGCASLDGERFDSVSLARDLIDQCKEHYAQVKED